MAGYGITKVKTLSFELIDMRSLRLCVSAVTQAGAAELIRKNVNKVHTKNTIRPTAKGRTTLSKSSRGRASVAAAVKAAARLVGRL